MSKRNKAYKIAYYILTVLLSALMLFSAYGSLKGGADVEAMMTHLGYPMYVLTMLSYLKILGVVALWQTKFPNLREWAYAGFFFDMLGAGISFMAVGDPASAYLPIFVMTIVLVLGSYVCMRKLKM